MSALKWRAWFFAGLLCLCLTLPFNARSGAQSPPAADASPQNTTENQPAANQPIGNQSAASAGSSQPKPAENRPTPAANAVTPAPAAKSSNGPSPQSKAAYESATVLRVTTRLVMIDVVATDSHGHAVVDLEPKDFTVFEDGTQQTVRV